jgi:hypothetical protein
MEYWSNYSEYQQRRRTTGTRSGEERELPHEDASLRRHRQKATEAF